MLRWKSVLMCLLAIALVAGCAPQPTPKPEVVVKRETVIVPATEVPQPVVTQAPKEPAPFVFGAIFVGDNNDRGWSQANKEGCDFVVARLPGLVLYTWEDNANSAAKPNRTVEEMVDDMVKGGAKLILTTSDDFKDQTRAAAKKYPEVVFIHVSGDDVWTGKAPPNLGNIMGKMEYGKFIAGYAAALSSQTGSIAYLGPLINDETRRLVSAAYLGALHGWKERGNDPAKLKFVVNWIGFWFKIPGVTLDPTQVAHDFYNSGVDVVLSGIDTPEALTVAAQLRKEGKQVWAIPYDYSNACSVGDEACLGVPYFNWGPAYLKTVQQVMAGTWKQSFDWNDPDWDNINNPETTAVGFLPGPAMSGTVQQAVEKLAGQLGRGEVKMFVGPLNFQDGSPYLASGQEATAQQVWYFPQLLAGMEGPSK